VRRGCDRNRRQSDFLCTRSTANGYSLEGWLLHGGWRSRIQGGSGDRRIRLDGVRSGQSISKELRVIELRGAESFLGVHVSRMLHKFPAPSGFLFGGPRGRAGDQIAAAYPRPDWSFADAKNLDYVPEA
jgi:hypothetical protein